MQLAVKMLVPFFVKSGFFLKKHGMWMNMKQQQRFLRDPDSRSTKAKKNKSPLVHPG